MPRIVITVDEEYPVYDVRKPRAGEEKEGFVVMASVTPKQWRRLQAAARLAQWRRTLLVRLYDKAAAGPDTIGSEGATAESEADEDSSTAPGGTMKWPIQRTVMENFNIRTLTQGRRVLP